MTSITDDRDSEITVSDGRLEDHKRERTPLPKLQLAIVFLIQFAEPITALVVYPFVNQLVRETGITGGDESKTGYYAGIIESTFFFSETLTVFAWGWLSDNFGRKPILIMGPLGLSIAMIGFGWTKTYWPLVFYRIIQGIFNGNIGVSKSIMGEITDETNIGDAYALAPLMWAAGLTIGPTIGGVFSNPANRWPDVFGKLAFFHKYPYFLPCLIAGFIAFLSFAISLVALKETLPASRKIKVRDAWGRVVKKINPKPSKFDDSTTPLLSNTQSPHDYGTSEAERGVPAAPAHTEDKPPLTLLFSPSFLTILLNFGLLSFTEMGASALLPLMCSTPIEYGGLGMDPYTIGVIMGIYGIANGVISATLFGRILRRYGPKRVFQVGILSFFVVFAGFPVANMLARREGVVDGYVLAVVAVQLLGMTVLSPCYASMGIMVVNHAPDKRLLGSANGAAQMVTSGSRAFAPAVVSSLFSISMQHNLAGGYAVYYILIAISVVVKVCSAYLP